MLLSKQRCLHEFGSVALFAAVIRWVVSLYPYSGQKKPPMHGDFEAQRHWMEITYNLPVGEWYHNSTNNDLNYWGLDYPPLTAYHSWICGFVARLIDPSWVALPESRGIETEAHKLFMRTTAMVADVVIYFPAIFALVYQRRTVHGGFPYILRICAEVCVALLAPPQILIDHGHFQYNCVSLGLTAWAIFAIDRHQDVVAAILFSLALNYKQMSMYLALPFFFYLLGRCWQLPVYKGFTKLAAIGSAVIVTFILCWLPFLTSVNDAGQVLHRLFPFARGIFEDKVANVWCALNVIVKLRAWNISTMATISSVITLLSCSVSCYDLFRNPNDQKFKYSLLNCGLLFFLFSFQVHEKGILLAALPATLLLADDGLACTWFIAAATFSMFPLLLKDGLAIPCFATVALFLVLSHSFILWKFKEPEAIERDETEAIQYDFFTALMVLSLSGFVGLSLASAFAPVFHRLPDLWPLLLSVYSCGHFIGFAIYFHLRQFSAEPVLLKVGRKLTKRE